MNREKDLAKNTAIISLGRICTQFMSFFLLPLYTSILNTSEYGTADLLISYASLLLPIVTFAIEQALFRYLIDVRSDERQKETIISTTVIFAICQVLLAVILLSILQVFIKNMYMPYFILMVVACTLSATMLQLSRGLGDNIGYALGSFVTAAVQILCNVLYLVVLKLGANGMLLATFTGNIACTLMLVAKTKTYRYIKLSKFDMPTLKQMLRYSAPLIPNQLSWWMMNASNKTIVAFFLGTASNGLLAVAQKFPSIYIQFNNIFNISWTESATLHIHEDDAELFFSKIVDTTFRLFACACIGIIVCIPFVIGWLINPAYYDAYYQIPIFMLASLCNVVVSLYGVIYVAYKRTKEIALTALYAAIINAGSHLIMIRFIGLYAAAFSTLLGYGVMAVYRYYHSRKYLVIRLSNKLLMTVAFMIMVALGTYYSERFVLHLIGFFVVTLLSFYLNIDFVRSILATVQTVIHNWIKNS